MKINLFILILSITLNGCTKYTDTEKKNTEPPPSRIEKSEVIQKTDEQLRELVMDDPVKHEETQYAKEPAKEILHTPTTDIPIPIKGRTWTSVDGRKIEAELIARTIDTVTIKRNLDQKEFTIPLSSLSVSDIDFVSSSSVQITEVKMFDLNRLNELKKNIPTLTPNPPLESSFPNLTENFNKYKRHIESLSKTGYSRSLGMIRSDIESDLKRFEPVAATNLKSPPRYHPSSGWSKGSGAWKEVWAARSIVSWLKGPMLNYLAELEKIN